MSQATRIQHEAADAMVYMGIDPSAAEHDEKVGQFYRAVIASLTEFGPDTVHPTHIELTEGEN